MMTSTTSSAGIAPPRVRATAVTVAICTRGRPDALRRALASVVAQQPPAAQILVIDNAPLDDATEDMVRGEYPQVAYRQEPVPGLDFARNRALIEATEEIVLFVDDDVILEPGSLERLAKAFLDVPQAGACTGRVLALSLNTQGQRLFEANGGFERGAKRVRLPRDSRRLLHGLPAPRIAWALSVGSGSCLAVRRNVAVFLGGFDEALDLGPVLPGGGDHDMLWRILEAGHEVVYAPDVRARHSHRTSVDGVVAQIAGHQKALIALLTKTWEHSRLVDRVPILAYLAWRLIKPGFRLIARAVGRDPLPVSAILEMWRACWSGLTAYPMGMRVAATRRRKAGS